MTLCNCWNNCCQSTEEYNPACIIHCFCWPVSFAQHKSGKFPVTGVIDALCIPSLMQAIDSRDSMAMALYSQCFAWVIKKINSRIKSKEDFKSIGILDIFGFENFEVGFKSLFKWIVWYLFFIVLHIIVIFTGTWLLNMLWLKPVPCLHNKILGVR